MRLDDTRAKMRAVSAVREESTTNGPQLKALRWSSDTKNISMQIMKLWYAADTCPGGASVPLYSTPVASAIASATPCHQTMQVAS